MSNLSVPLCEPGSGSDPAEILKEKHKDKEACIIVVPVLTTATEENWKVFALEQEIPAVGSSVLFRSLLTLVPIICLT